MEKTRTKFLAGLLCMALIFADAAPTGLVAQAAGASQQAPVGTEVWEESIISEESESLDEKGEQVISDKEVSEEGKNPEVTESNVEEEKGQIPSEGMDGQGDEDSHTPSEEQTDMGNGEIGEEAETPEKENSEETEAPDTGLPEEEENVEIKEPKAAVALDAEGVIASGTYKDGESDTAWVIDGNGKLTVTGTGEVRNLTTTPYAPWSAYREKIIEAEITVKGMKNADHLFSSCSNLTKLDISDWDTSQVTTMIQTFYMCNNLSSLDVSRFETGNVTDMFWMFYGCSNLSSLDVSGWDTSRATRMNGMFRSCSNLSSLDVSDWNTGQVTDMSRMFEGCSNLSSLDVSGWDTSQVTDMSHMFESCGNLSSLDLSGLETDNVKNMESMFWGCSSLSNLDLSGLETGNVTNMRAMFANCSNLSSLDLSELETGNVTDMSSMFYRCSNLSSLDLSGLETGNVTDMSYMFTNCSNLSSLDLSGLETGNVTDMEWMFSECSNLSSLDLSELETDNVKNMGCMFYGCSNLSSLDVNGWDTSQVTDMSSMFEYCSNLVSLDLSGLETGNVTDMGHMFKYCSNLASLDLSGLETGNVTDMSDMFRECSNLSSLDVSGWDTSQVTDMGQMFYQCSNLSSLDLSGFETGNVRDMGDMFHECSNLSSLDISGWDASQVTNMYAMFYRCSNLSNLNLSGFKTGNVTNMTFMFGGCSNLSSLDVSGFETGNVTDMFAMFNYCINLSSLDVSGFETGNVTNMAYMFSDCSNLSSLDLSGFETSNVTDMRLMFSGCSNLSSLDVSGWDTSQVTNMSLMFYQCSNLSSLDLSGFETGNVTGMGCMFELCSNLSSLDVSGFKTGNVTDMGAMFYGCENLTEINLSSFDARQVTDMNLMFRGCNNLEIIHTPLNLTLSVDLPRDSGEIWTQPDGTGITLLPQNLGESIIITKRKLSIAGEPYITVTKVKTSYVCGETLNLDDLTVTYNDGKGEDSTVTGYSTNAADIDMSTEGTKELVITYNGLTCTINITVVKNTENENPDNPEKPEPHITATKVKTSYVCGETLNLDDLTVTYNDGLGNEIKVTDYTTNAADIDMSTVGEKELIITYRELTYIVNIMVKEQEGGNTGETDEPENTEGLKIDFSEPGKEYIYTGSAITPSISVTNNGKLLVEGTDYTVKYSGNTKATDSAKVVISGKGNLTGKNQTLTFRIKKKLLDNSDISADDKITPTVGGDIVTVTEGSKASPVITYNGVKLSNNKDYVLSDTDKNHKWNLEESNPTITVIGKGNFDGTMTLKVIVISKAEQKNRKIKVDIMKGFKGYTYDGSPKDIREHLSVYTAQTSAGQLEEFEDYVISYPADITGTGTKKITITGISDKCMGSVTKSYKINPKKADFTTEYNSNGYGFVSGGTKVYDLVVKAGDTELTEGRDYKVTYSGNKKVSSNAKFTVTGMGNYKGSKCTKTFTINAVALNNNPDSNSEMTKGLKIAAGDMVFKNAGIYKSTPYVDLNGVTLKKADYTVSYYLDDPRTNPNAEVMDKNHKVNTGDTTVWVKIVGKGNYANTDNTCYVVASYKVRTKQEQSFDLSKAKISFRDSNGSAIKKIEYSGNPIDDDDINVVVTCKINGIDTILKAEDYTIDFFNNVNKGKAVVIIKGAEDQTTYVGSKTASFSIVAKKL